MAAYVGGNAKTRKQAIAAFSGFQQTLQDSWKMAAYTMQNGGVSKNAGTKVLQQSSEIDMALEILQKQADNSDDIGFKAGVGMATIFKNIADAPFLSWPSTLLATSDDFFKTMVADAVQLQHDG